MTSVPPLLPEHTLARVQALARRNGWSIVLVAALAALLSAAQRDAMIAVLGLLAAGCGAMEVHGAGLLRHGDRRGTSWLIRAELCLLLVITVYCSLRLLHPDLEEIRSLIHALLRGAGAGAREQWEEALRVNGLTEDMYISFVNRLVAIVFAFVSLFYQGGLAIYYARRQKAIDLALSAE
jgi:hypothetical protein